MGLDFGYELIAERAAADRLLRSLSEHMAPEDRVRLLAAMANGGCAAFRHIARKGYERPVATSASGDRSVCFGFLFPPDPALEEYVKGSTPPVVGCRLQVGCVWTTFRCGERFVVLRAVAATTGMSRLFEQSRSVRDTFTQIGRAGGAALVLFDDEQLDLCGVWPRVGRFLMTADVESCYDDAGDLLVDCYSERVLGSARATLGSGATEAGA